MQGLNALHWPQAKIQKCCALDGERVARIEFKPFETHAHGSVRAMYYLGIFLYYNALLQTSLILEPDELVNSQPKPTSISRWCCGCGHYYERPAA